MKGVIPDETERKIINKIIFDELVKGKIRKESKLVLIEIINKLKDKNCDTRLLARAALKEAIN